MREKQGQSSLIKENQDRENRDKESRKKECRDQRMRLREFDKELFSYTGQIAWLLPGCFAFAALSLMCIPVQEIGREDGYLWMSAFVCGMWISCFVLHPYVNITGPFEGPKNNRNRTYNRLKYLPVSRKQYIIVRMGYLFRYVWKLTLAGMAVQCIAAAVEMGRAEPVNVAYAAGVLLIMPLAAGWIQLKIDSIDVTL